MNLSAIVLTRNEERNIAECLSSVSFAEELLVVDSGSADRTLAIAAEHGARVIAHPFSDFASQRNFAMSQAKGDWVLFIDADERVRNCPHWRFTPFRGIIISLGKDSVSVIRGETRPSGCFPSKVFHGHSRSTKRS